MSDAYYENLFLAAEFEMAASFKTFEEKVAATGRDLEAPAVTLRWGVLAGLVMQYLIRQGLNPLDIPVAELDHLLDRVSDALECSADNDLWDATIHAGIGDLIPELLEKYGPQQRESPEFPDGEFPNGSRYTETSEHTVGILEHRRDCKCPECSADAYLEAGYEDRVSGGGDDCIGGPYEDRECNLFGPDGGDDFADIYLDSAGAIDDQPDEPCDDCGDDI